MPAQYISVPMPWGGDEVGIVYCPVCARKVVSKRRCDHLLFVYLDEAGDFDWVHPKLRDKLKNLRLDRITNPTKRLAREIRSESAICFYFTANVTGGGIGVGIDFAEPEGSDPL